MNQNKKLGKVAPSKGGNSQPPAEMEGGAGKFVVACMCFCCIIVIVVVVLVVA